MKKREREWEIHVVSDSSGNLNSVSGRMSL